MQHRRSGTSLCEVICALVVIAMASSLALHAATAAERAIGHAHRRTAAVHRAALELAALGSLPCDTASVTRRITEPRWQLDVVRTSLGPHRADDVVLRSHRGDTIRVARHRWCSR
jgi:hypothetical protein